MMRTQTAHAQDAQADSPPMRNRRASGFVLNVALKFAYPAVLLGAWFWNAPRIVGCLLFALIWLQRCVGKGVLGASLRRLSRIDWAVALMLSAASAGIVWTNSERLLRIYPSLVNLGLLIAFGATLARGPSMIEKFARIGTPDLSDAAVLHTRRVTQIWCAFFAANGLFSLHTALHWPREAWSLYNGVISYCLIGALLLGEIVWRYLVILPRARRAEPA